MENSTIHFEGIWKNGTASGMGRAFYLNQITYEGHWENGNENGWGSLLSSEILSYIDISYYLTRITFAR